MFKARIKPLTFAIVLAGLGPMMLSAPVSAAVDQKSAATIQEKVTVKPGKTINPQEETVISSAGAKVLRDRWQAHIDASLSRPVLIVDEAQEMKPPVLAELRLLSSARLDSHILLTVVLAGDSRLLERLRCDELLPLGSRMRVRRVVPLAHTRGCAARASRPCITCGHPARAQYDTGSSYPDKAAVVKSWMVRRRRSRRFNEDIARSVALARQIQARLTRHGSPPCEHAGRWRQAIVSSGQIMAAINIHIFACEPSLDNALDRSQS